MVRRSPLGDSQAEREGSRVNSLRRALDTAKQSLRRAWYRWRYVKVGSTGALSIDPRWYVVTGAWDRAMRGLKAL